MASKGGGTSGGGTTGSGASGSGGSGGGSGGGQGSGMPGGFPPGMFPPGMGMGGGSGSGGGTGGGTGSATGSGQNPQHADGSAGTTSQRNAEQAMQLYLDTDRNRVIGASKDPKERAALQSAYDLASSLSSLKNGKPPFARDLAAARDAMPQALATGNPTLIQTAQTNYEQQRDRAMSYTRAIVEAVGDGKVTSAQLGQIATQLQAANDDAMKGGKTPLTQAELSQRAAAIRASLEKDNPSDRTPASK